MLFKLFWVGLFSCLSLYAYNFLVLLDFNKSSIYRIRPGKCEQLKGIEYGSEDFAIIEELDLAFITSGMYYVQERPAEARGRIFLYDLNTKNDPRELPIRGMPHREKFHPHGISHWLDGNKIILYIISHEPPNFTHSIEVFEVDLAKKELIFVKSIRNEKFVRPNTIVTVGNEKLIIANDGMAQSQLGMFWEFISFKKAGSLVYFDGKESFWLGEGMSSTTAVATDRQKKHLIVGFVNEKALRVFELTEDFHKISEISKIELKTAPDNFYVDEENIIWMGAHPVVNLLILHVGEADNRKSYAPSQVLRVKFTENWKNAEIWQIFSDDGQFISASSSAAYHRKSKKLLIGSMARQAVVCDLLYDTFE